MATVISRPRGRARFLILFCRRRRRSALPRRLRLRANNSLLSVTFLFPPFPVPVLALYFGLATWVQPSHPASPRPSSVSGANLVLPTGSFLSSLPLSAAVLYASFGAMTVGTNGLTCGFNWQCTANGVGYAVMVTARLDSLPSSHFHGLGPPRPGGSRGEGVPVPVSFNNSMLSSHLFWTSDYTFRYNMWMHQPGSHRTHRPGITPSFCGALAFKKKIARRIQPSLSLLDREVEFCVPTNIIDLRLLGHDAREKKSQFV